MTLADAYERLRSCLEPLGVEIGPDVLAVWLDRRRSGRPPLPDTALRGLAAWSAEQLAARRRDGASTGSRSGDDR